MADRLNFVDVEHAVAGLPDRMLEELVKGPLPDGDDATSPWNCRVCSVLRGPRRLPPAEQLLDWHEFEAEVEAVDRVLGKDAVEGAIADRPDAGPESVALLRDAAEQWQQVAGMLSHARCCTIYALARIELAGRRL